MIDLQKNDIENSCSNEQNKSSVEVSEGSQKIDNSVETPLNKQLKGLAAPITKASYVIAALIIVGRLIGFVLKLINL